MPSMSLCVAEPYAIFAMKDLGSDDKSLSLCQPHETRKRKRLSDGDDDEDDHDHDQDQGVSEREGLKLDAASAEINPQSALVRGPTNIEAEENQQGDCTQQIGATVYYIGSQTNAGLIEAAAQNNILLVEDLPLEDTDRWATAYFRSYPGFKGTCLIEGKPGMAYVEFENVRNAELALTIETRTTINPKKVTYASK